MFLGKWLATVGIGNLVGGKNVTPGGFPAFSGRRTGAWLKQVARQMIACLPLESETAGN
jgi:hypothetical protein